jgi:hypothetical protein
MKDLKGIDFLYIAAAIAGLYVVYNIVQGTKAAASAVADAGSAALALPGQAGTSIGNALYDFVHPDAGGASGESIDYITTFPDGTKAAVPNTIVDSQGRFTRNDVAYQLKRNAAGQAVAVAL